MPTNLSISTSAKQTINNISVLKKSRCNIKNSDLETDTVKIQGRIVNKIPTVAKPRINIICAFVEYLYPTKNQEFSTTEFQTIKQKFNQIFHKNYKDCEICSMIDEYKKIFRIDDVNEFSNQIFNRIKCDAGYADKNIELLVRKCKSGTANTGKFIPAYARIVMDVECTNNKINSKNKRILFASLIHEFQHVHQHELAYHSDRERYVKYILKDIKIEDIITLLKGILKCNKAKIKEYGGENTIKNDINNLIEKDPETVALYQASGKANIEHINNIKKIFGNSKQYNKNSEEYKYGSRYLKNWEHYIQPILSNIEKYQKQLVEWEAYTMQDIAIQVLKLIGL